MSLVTIVSPHILLNIKCHMHVLPALVFLATLNFQVVCSALIVNFYCFVLNCGEFLGCAAILAAAQPLKIVFVVVVVVVVVLCCVVAAKSTF